MDKFRLEFSEAQQSFHLDNNTHVENTHGWQTIAIDITNREFIIFKHYIDLDSRKKLTCKSIMRDYFRFKRFLSKLNEYGINIISQ